MSATDKDSTLQRIKEIHESKSNSKTKESSVRVTTEVVPFADNYESFENSRNLQLRNRHGQNARQSEACYNTKTGKTEEKLKVERRKTFYIKDILGHEMPGD